MSDSVLKQVTSLQNLNINELKQFYVTLHGTEPSVYSKGFLIKRVAHRLQEIAYGGLSERVQKKLDDILDENGFDEKGMQTNKPRGRLKQVKNQPIAGAVFVRDWNSKRYQVTALDDGFEYDGKKYRSLTAVAQVITGVHRNGRAFFGLDKQRNNT